MKRLHITSKKGLKDIIKAKLNDTYVNRTVQYWIDENPQALHDVIYTSDKTLRVTLTKSTYDIFKKKMEEINGNS